MVFSGDNNLSARHGGSFSKWAIQSERSKCRGERPKLHCNYRAKCSAAIIAGRRNKSKSWMSPHRGHGDATERNRLIRSFGPK
jgi:hypothetical protein